VSPPPGDWDHWVSFSTRHLPDNPRRLSGVVSIYLCTEDGPHFDEVAVLHDPHGQLPRKTDGQPLYAHRLVCLPPLDTIFLLGGKQIQDWLRGNGWQRDWGYNSNFPDSAPVEQYQKTFQAEHPFFHEEETFAMLGGWNLPFDDDWAELVKKPLLLLTIRESEPWLEVYDDGSELVGFSRIT
jgi:hypothetical protein